MKWIIQILAMRPILWLLLIINILGTVYGYIWYGSQLAETPTKFLIFVPDSPTASMFFCFVLILFLWKKNIPIIEALAVITLFKYGIWAVVMNLLVWYVAGSIDWQSGMLIFSHGSMAVQGLLYAPYYRIRPIHLALAAIWTLHNDVIDYVFGMMPRYYMLNEYIPQIGYFTFWLSIASITVTYVFCMRKNSPKYTL